MRLKSQDGLYRMSGHWYVLAAAVLWGTTGTAQAFAPGGAPTGAVGAMRLAVGGTALLILAIVWGELRPGGKRWPVLATIFASGSMAAYQLVFFAAVARTGVAVGTMVTIGSAPVLAGALGWKVYDERPGPRWLVATVLATIGCGFLILSGGRINLDVVGISLALGAGLAYAIYTVASKRLLETHHPKAVTAVVFCLGALLLSPLLFVTDLSWVAQWRGVAVVLHLGIVTTAIAYTLFARGLQGVPVATAVTLSLAEPLTAGTLGIFLLGERLTLAAFIGIGLLFTGLALLALNRTIANR